MIWLGLQFEMEWGRSRPVCQAGLIDFACIVYAVVGILAPAHLLAQATPIAPDSFATQAVPSALPPGTFLNPLLPAGADPAVTQRNGFYYYMQTMGANLTIWKTRDLTDLRNATKQIVWTPPSNGPAFRDIWAPELIRLHEKWYIYFAADDGNNESHRIYVLENASDDPLAGAWTMKGKLADPTADTWAIDPSVFEIGKKDYVLWSGWVGPTNGAQSIFIARLKNPWTLKGHRTMVSTPQYPWEKVGDLDNGKRGTITIPHVDVNEGPEILRHGDRLFLIYSASGCWTNYYELGMLSTSTRSNLLRASSWAKLPTPVFVESPESGVFGPGHNTFFHSPDGKEDWIVYHANAGANQGCGNARSPRAQKITWRPDGTPDFGKPLPTTQVVPKPSGTL